MDWLVQTRPLLTIIAVVTLLASSALLSRAIKRLQLRIEQRRRVNRMARAAVAIAMATIIVIIWAQKLKSVALVVGAFAVAIVIALRELLQCTNGWTLKMASHSFRIGDRITVGDASGEVIDYSVLTTSLLGREGAATGSVVTLPNSQFLSKPVRNETGGMAHGLRSQVVAVAKDQSVEQSRELLLGAAEQAFAAYKDVVEEEVKRFEVARDATFGPIAPRVHVKGIDDKGVQLELTMMVPVGSAGDVLDNVLTAYLAGLAQPKPADAASSD